MGLTTSDSHLCFFLLICRQNSVVRQGKLSYIPRLANDNQLGDIPLHTLHTFNLLISPMRRVRAGKRRAAVPPLSFSFSKLSRRAKAHSG